MEWVKEMLGKLEQSWPNVQALTKVMKETIKISAATAAQEAKINKLNTLNIDKMFLYHR